MVLAIRDKGLANPGPRLSCYVRESIAQYHSNYKRDLIHALSWPYPVTL